MNPFVAHLIGDFILQNEWMATKKTQSSFVCMVHVLVYLVPFLLCNLQWWQIALIGAQHFVEDRKMLFTSFWMRVWKRVPPENWNLRLFVDQAFHIVWIEVVVLIGEKGLSFLSI
jgi:hypothetical protein